MYNELKTNIVQIEIDNGSGFCFGVTTAIKKAEEELAKGGKLYCLGDIVHNGMEVATPSNLNRLRRNVGNNPNYQFMDAVEFHKLFED